MLVGRAGRRGRQNGTQIGVLAGGANGLAPTSTLLFGVSASGAGVVPGFPVHANPNRIEAAEYTCSWTR